MARIFIAVTLDPPTLRALTSFIDGRPIRGEGIRWVRPESLHLTLKFLGEVDLSALEHVTRAVVDASRCVSPFEVAVRGVGFFPNADRPRVFWAGVESGPELEVLADEIETAMAGLGFRKEARRFTAHITLARIKGPRRMGSRSRRRAGSDPCGDRRGGGEWPRASAGSGRIRLEDPLEDLMVAGHPLFGRPDVTEVAVMESTLGPGGPRYTRVATASLGGDTV